MFQIEPSPPPFDDCWSPPPLAALCVVPSSSECIGWSGSLEGFALLLELVWLLFLPEDNLRARLEIEEDPFKFIFLEEGAGLLLREFESMEEDGVRCFESLDLAFGLVMVVGMVGLEEGARLTTLAMILSPVVWIALVGTVLVVSTGMLLDGTTGMFFGLWLHLFAKFGAAS